MPARNHKDLLLYRRLLVIAGSVYLIWWFAVHLMLESDYNPLGSRIAVVGYFILMWGLSFPVGIVRRHVHTLYHFGVYALTLHYFYLFYMNAGNSNWVTGSFITVLAICYCFFQMLPLLGYSIFVAAIATILAYRLPHLQHSVFLPGIATVLLQANIGLWARRVITRQLTESNERFQLLFNSASEGMLVHENAKVVQANEAMARILGYSRRELLGFDLFRLVHPDMHEITRERIATGTSTPYETLGLRKDGSEVPIEVTPKMIAFGGKHLRLVLAQDLTERKKMETEKVHALTMQENLRSRDEFISLASHELKTPLTSLRLWNQMVERSQRDGRELAPDKVREFTALSGKQIARLTALVNDMLDVSQISSGKFTLRRERVDLGVIVRDAIQSLRPQSESASSPIQLNSEGELPVMGDPARLFQVVENLLTNATKYGNRKPIHVSLARKGGWVELKVTDQGFGIPRDQLDRIFQRFERVTSERNITGLGLGLYLSKQFVIAQGGTIEVESELNRGSTFTVKLPVA